MTAVVQVVVDRLDHSSRVLAQAQLASGDERLHVEDGPDFAPENIGFLGRKPVAGQQGGQRGARGDDDDLGRGRGRRGGAEEEPRPSGDAGFHAAARRTENQQPGDEQEGGARRSGGEKETATEPPRRRSGAEFRAAEKPLSAAHAAPPEVPDILLIIPENVPAAAKVSIPSPRTSRSGRFNDWPSRSWTGRPPWRCRP